MTNGCASDGDDGIQGLGIRLEVCCGTDISEVSRIERAILGKGGQRFLDKVYTVGERSYCEKKRAGRFQSYAARFAAKEALVKAVGTGLLTGIHMTEIEVVNDAYTGQPFLQLHGVASKIYDELGGVSLSVSLSHTKEYAIANIVILRSV